MRNVYQFIMMVGTIAIGVLLLATFAYVFRIGAIASKNVDEEQLKQQLIADNAQFEYYNKENNDENKNTVSDMISLANLVYDFNEKNYVDENSTLKLVIQIGNDANNLKYVIPKTNSRGTKRLGKKELFVSDSESNSDTISVYDLAESEEIISSSNVSFSTGEKKEHDTLSTTRYDSTTNKTIYKYLFDCAEIRYNINSGRPEYMILKAYINDKY